MNWWYHRERKTCILISWILSILILIFFGKRLSPSTFGVVHNPTFMFGKWANTYNLVFAHFPYIKDNRPLWTTINIEEEKHFYHFFLRYLPKQSTPFQTKENNHPCYISSSLYNSHNFCITFFELITVADVPKYWEKKKKNLIDWNQESMRLSSNR